MVDLVGFVLGAAVAAFLEAHEQGRRRWSLLAPYFLLQDLGVHFKRLILLISSRIAGGETTTRL